MGIIGAHMLLYSPEADALRATLSSRSSDRTSFLISASCLKKCSRCSYGIPATLLRLPVPPGPVALAPVPAPGDRLHVDDRQLRQVRARDSRLQLGDLLVQGLVAQRPEGLVSRWVRQSHLGRGVGPGQLVLLGPSPSE